MLDQIQNLAYIIPIVTIGIVASTIIGEFYTKTHPRKIMLIDDKIIMYSLFRKKEINISQIESIKPLSILKSSWGLRYEIIVLYQGRKKRFILHNQEIRKLDEFIRLVSSKTEK